MIIFNNKGIVSSLIVILLIAKVLIFSLLSFKAILLKYQRDTILTTEKDFVKLKKFGFNIILLKLKVEFSPKMKKKLSNIF